MDKQLSHISNTSPRSTESHSKSFALFFIWLLLPISSALLMWLYHMLLKQWCQWPISLALMNWPTIGFHECSSEIEAAYTGFLCCVPQFDGLPAVKFSKLSPRLKSFLDKNHPQPLLCNTMTLKSACMHKFLRKYQTVSRMLVSFYISSSNVWTFQLLCILITTCYCQYFLLQPFQRVCSDISSWF